MNYSQKANSVPAIVFVYLHILSVLILKRDQYLLHILLQFKINSSLNTLSSLLQSISPYPKEYLKQNTIQSFTFRNNLYFLGENVFLAIKKGPRSISYDLNIAEGCNHKERYRWQLQFCLQGFIYIVVGQYPAYCIH